MKKYRRIPIKDITGRQRIEKLSIDGIVPFDEFEKTFVQQYRSEITGIYYYLEQISLLRSLPNTKFKDVTPKGEEIKEYELKTKHLRVYMIAQEGGKLLILGGQKNSQKKDFRTFRSIKSQYIQTLAINTTSTQKP